MTRTYSILLTSPSILFISLLEIYMNNDNSTITPHPPISRIHLHISVFFPLDRRSVWDMTPAGSVRRASHEFTSLDEGSGASSVRSVHMLPSSPDKRKRSMTQLAAKGATVKGYGYDFEANTVSTAVGT